MCHLFQKDDFSHDPRMAAEEMVPFVHVEGGVGFKKDLPSILEKKWQVSL